MRTTLLQFTTGAALLLAALTPTAGASEEASSDSSQVVPASADTLAAQPEAVLYYFHRTLRCQTCLTIEAYIDEALRTHFADELGDGRLLWLPTNIEEPENVHFEEDFALEFNSAILVEFDGTETRSWANLEKVWDLLGNKEGFSGYIVEMVGPALADEDTEPN